MNLTSGRGFAGSGNRQQWSAVLRVPKCVFLRRRFTALRKILLGSLTPGGFTRHMCRLKLMFRCRLCNFL